MLRFADIVWDFDGTLFDTYPAMVKALQKSLADLGVVAPQDELLSQMKVSILQAIVHYCERHGLVLDDVGARFASHEARLTAEGEGIAPFPGAVEVCKLVVAGGGRNFIITHRGNSTHSLLDRFGMTSLFSDVITSEHGFKRKPDPEAFIYVVKKHGIDVARGLAVGDRDLDLVAARGAGLHTCLFDPDGFYTGFASDFSITSLADLEQILCDSQNAGREAGRNAGREAGTNAGRGEEALGSVARQ